MEDAGEMNQNQTEIINLSNMEEADRNQWITENAKILVLKYFPDYYKDVTPFIVCDTVRYGKNKGRAYYAAYFPYDQEKELRYFEVTNPWGQKWIREVYSSKVGFWCETGAFICVSNAHSYSFCAEPSEPIVPDSSVYWTLPPQRKLREESKTASTPTDDINWTQTLTNRLPELKGGESALDFVSANLNYPAESKARGVQGIVVVACTIEKDGTLTHMKVIQSLDPACDAEALRIIQLMPKWEPAVVHNVAVQVQHTIPVRFKLSQTR